MKNIDIQIGVDPTVSYCWTRNGSPKLLGLEVWTTDPQTDAIVFIEGVGARGTFTKSGFRINKNAMTALCKAWLAEVSP